MLNRRFDQPITIEREFPYLLHLPPDYDASRQQMWPIVLFLHGYGERGDDLNLLKTTGLTKYLTTHPEFPMIVVAPQCPLDSYWTLELDTVNGLLTYILATQAADHKRIYLTGLSMGGFGAWHLAIKYPHRFAALAPVSGGGVPVLADRLRHVAVWAFHGALDEIVPPIMSQVMVEAVRATGAAVRFTLYEDLGHDAWTRTYENRKLYEWMLQHQRYQGGG